MAASKQPRVLLFDIGGVCVSVQLISVYQCPLPTHKLNRKHSGDKQVVSPFQTILDYELSLGIPPGWINYSISKTSPNGFWHKLERGEIAMDGGFFEGFNRDLHDPARWEEFYRREASKYPDRLSKEVPPVPTVDGEWLFNEMMRASNPADPWMFPALKNLKASGKYIVAALSNTVIFPAGHPLYTEDMLDHPVRRVFDVFMSSAHIGIRKPDPRMYQYALKTVSEYAQKHGQPPVQASDITFLDDIGENLREARAQGFKTIKVPLGKAFEAVEELEKITGLKLAGDHPKIPVEPKIPPPRARI
jgi:FMN phosphatase YigB (HAD superfamily)